ncbi:MAG: protein translocase subunit SecD [Deltaproteobacteria bacterium]|nr:protein translocase subunit SecD [Deltaproteobacteria bacterium]
MTSNLKTRLIVFGVVILLGFVFLYPTIRVAVKKMTGQQISSEDMFGNNWITRPIALGLDLSGGVHLVYQVKAREAVASRLQSTANSVRDALRREKIPVTKALVVDPLVKQKTDAVSPPTTDLGNKPLIELTLLSEQQVEKAKSLIEDKYRTLNFRAKHNDDGRVRLVYGISESEAASIERNAISQSVETLRARVDQFGVAEPLIQRVGDDRIMLQMPGLQDIEAVKNVVGKMAKLEFRFLPTPGRSAGTVTLKDRSGADIEVEDVVQMTGDAVQDARADFEAHGQALVSLTLTSEGGKDFASITGANVGRFLAIILDGVVYSSPRIQERIAGGRCSITGNFSLKEASQLAVVLRAGALPAPLTIMEERVVGATLGRESIQKGILGSLVGCALIALFMTVYYRKSGMVAVGVLVVNLFLLLAILSAFGATLTLPGLAGLALTFGMAVDASVIIYERVREELRKGISRDAAVDTGFERALSAVIDSNITTLISAIILYYFGTGPVRGFAVTLSIGIVTTVFCASFVSRLAFDYWSLKGGPKEELSI